MSPRQKPEKGLNALEWLAAGDTELQMGRVPRKSEVLRSSAEEVQGSPASSLPGLHDSQAMGSSVSRLRSLWVWTLPPWAESSTQVGVSVCTC